MNDVVSYSELRERLKSCLDKVCGDHVPLLVKRRNGGDVVILSKEDYDAMDETSYLLRSPANAAALKAALERPAEERIPVSVEELKHELGI